MLSKRIIACLDVRDGKVVKGINFEGLRDAGDPASLARRYNVEGIDEIVILDVTATLESRQARANTIRAVASEIFLPSWSVSRKSWASSRGGMKRGRASGSSARRLAIISPPSTSRYRRIRSFSDIFVREAAPGNRSPR